MIDYHQQDAADEIRRMTNQRGVDVVIEHVGESKEAAQGRRRLEESAQFGKIVLEV